MPLAATCRSWLNWIGCSRATFCRVTQGDIPNSYTRPSRRPIRRTPPTMLTREMVLALREKICDISPYGAARTLVAQAHACEEWHRRTSLRELTRFSADAQQLFCERFHLAVKF